MSQDSTLCMRRCLQLAELGLGQTAPNPMVGAILVHGDRIIGEGYHLRAGAAHAEVDCLQHVLPEDVRLIPEATLYVSLEPCCHHGKTPPCTDLIIRSGIKRVVIASSDPFPAVSGGGIRLLREAGIEVEVGILENEARKLNRRFFTFHQQHRPYVILKWAQTNNGFLGGASGERWKISNEWSQRLVHQWRSQEQAILIGYRTALNDDPSLTTRLVPGKNPLRMVVDPLHHLPSHLQIFNDHLPVVIFTAIQQVESDLITYVQYESSQLIDSIFKYCETHAIQSLLVEGGTATLELFLQSGYWDEIRRITASDLEKGNGTYAPVISDIKPDETFMLQNDRIDIFYHS